MRNLAKPERRDTPADVPFILTVGVPEDRYLSESARALNVLRRAGFRAAPTGHAAFEAIHEDPESLPQLREIGRSDEAPEDGS